MLDNTALVKAYANDDDSFSSKTNMAVTLCGVGQTVWVRAGTGTTSLIGNNNRDSTFTGVLLALVI